MSIHSMDDYDLEQNQVYIREKSNKPTRSINPSLGLIIAAVVLAVVLWNFISNWENQTTIARYLIAFYDYTIVEPLRLIPSIFEYSKNANFTPYNNLNIVITYLLTGAYIFIFIPFIIRLISKFLDKIKFKYKLTLFFSPAILYLLFQFATWLFK